VKLADVYFVENNQLGTWQQIGYNSPNGSNGSTSQSTNFIYDQNTVTTSDGSAATWGAYNRVALNDCATGNADVWTVKPTVSNGSVSWVAAVSDETTNGPCSVLTPNFNKIGK
jgi:hypothetical protein